MHLLQQWLLRYYFSHLKNLADRWFDWSCWLGGFISLRDQMGYSSFYANFFGTLALALLSELSARIFKQPATVFVIPGIIPLVPGLGIYKGMFAVINNDYNGGMSILLTAITDSCAIAVGVMLVSSLFRVLKIRKDRRFLIKYHGKDVC